MFSILNEIKDNSHFRTTSVVVSSIGTAAATYVLVAVTGYLSFGNSIGGNIVNMYKPSVSATIGRAAIVILVMFSYPLQVHPCRASVDAVSKWRWSSTRNRTNDGSPNRSVPLLAGRAKNPRDTAMSETRFAIITTVIIILSYTVAITVSSLEVVLAYVGSTGSTSISFILPGLFYYKISDPESPHHQRLVKDEDDELNDAEANGESDDESGDDGHMSSSQRLLSSSGFLRLKGNRVWRAQLLRKLSLALSIYGAIVMVVCLVTNTVFVAAH